MVEDQFTIDPHALHRELLRQPGLTRDAGNREADARHAYDQAKARLAVVEARLALAIRRNPGNYDLREKPTVDEVNAAVLLQQQHADAVKALSDARYAMDICSTASVAMVDRRKALERLVELLQLDYYAEREPRVGPATRQAVNQSLLDTERDGGVTDYNPNDR